MSGGTGRPRLAVIGAGDLLSCPKLWPWDACLAAGAIPDATGWCQLVKAYLLLGGDFFVKHGGLGEQSGDSVDGEQPGIQSRVLGRAGGQRVTRIQALGRWAFHGLFRPGADRVAAAT